MKKLKLCVVALAALTLFSCSKENVDEPDAVNRVLTVKIAKPASTKAIEAQGSSAAGTITMDNGVIFTLNGEVVTGAYVLDVSEAQKDAGQSIGDKVTTSTTVFIVANIPTATVTEWTTLATRPATLTAIKEASFAISAANGSDYKKATLCNTGATVTAPTASGDGKVLASVEISPVYSRLELPKVVGEGRVESFDVMGVYVDDFYPSYTVEGLFDGILNTMGQTPPTIDWAAKDEGTWPAVAKVATASSTEVWAYNLPSGNLPRLIIKLENVVISGATMTGAWYLSVKSYTGIDGDIFAPGNIYYITDGVKFDETDIASTPNPTKNDLSVKVSIKEWTIKSVGTVL